MPTKARYLADLLNASGELDSTGAVESIQDNISTLFSAGTHTGISFTYDDSNATFSAAVNQDAVAAGFYHKIAVTVSSMKYYLDGFFIILYQYLGELFTIFSLSILELKCPIFQGLFLEQ